VSSDPRSVVSLIVAAAPPTPLAPAAAAAPAAPTVRRTFRLEMPSEQLLSFDIYKPIC
jgi:hypothetical protein